MPEESNTLDARKPWSCSIDHSCSPNQPKCCFSGSNPLRDLDEFCCLCTQRRKSSPLACLGICILILTYTFLGAILFLSIEGTLSFQREETSVAASMPNLSQSENDGFSIRSKTVEKLWSITEDLNILYKENWTRLAARELMEFQKILLRSVNGGSTIENSRFFGPPEKHRWTFATSFLYSLTLITTIGYGNVTPKSPLGKLVSIAYACLGIPIVMVYLSTIGEALARNFRILYSKIFHIEPKPMHSPNCIFSQQQIHHSKIDPYKKLPIDKLDDKPRRTPFQAALNLEILNKKYNWKCRNHTRVPIILSILVVILYIALGTFLFHKTEKWSFIDGCYFSFSSLGTIGFGELYPGTYGSTVSSNLEDMAIGACCLYILIGIVVVAMCFNLIQEEITLVLRNLAAFCSGNTKPRAVHNSSRETGGEMCMSIVS